jgi:hypothetical protein
MINSIETRAKLAIYIQKIRVGVFTLFSKGIFTKYLNLIDWDLLYQNSMNACLLRLKMRGYSPLNVVDIGAFDGQWTVMLKSVFSKANVIMIEAQEIKKNSLEKICLRFSDTVRYK